MSFLDNLDHAEFSREFLEAYLDDGFTSLPNGKSTYWYCGCC